MKLSQIIFNALVMVHDESHDGVFFADDYLIDIANDCAKQIREEFKKAGVDVWKGGET